MKTNSPMFIKKAFGGLHGFQEDEILLRFMGHIDEVAALLAGGLSFTKAACFPEHMLEAEPTHADSEELRRFYGDIADYRLRRGLSRKRAILETAYISCWHRINAESNIERIVAEHTTASDIHFIIKTRLGRIWESLPGPDGSPWWLNHFPVIYLEDEEQKREDALQEQFPNCGYPDLLFKRPFFSWEVEARFVMHNGSATNAFPTPEMAINNAPTEKWKYVKVNAVEFIATIFVLNDESEIQLQSLIEKANFQPAHIKCSSAALKELILS